MQFSFWGTLLRVPGTRAAGPKGLSRDSALGSRRNGHERSQRGTTTSYFLFPISYFLFPISAGLVLTLALRADAQGPDPRSILSESLAPRDPSYVGSQVTVTRGEAGERIQRAQVFRQGAALRINFADGPILLDDGKVQTVYFPRRNLVERRPSQLTGARVQAQRARLRAGQGQVALSGEEAVAGRPCWKVILTLPNGVERSVWVDQQTQVPLRQDVTEKRGQSTSTYFTEISYHAPIPPGTFDFQPPATALVRETSGQARQRLPFPLARRMAERWGGLLTPRYLPSDYTLRGFFREELSGREWLVTVFAASGGAGSEAPLGIRPRRQFLRPAARGPAREGGPLLSLFQGPAMGMNTADFQKKGLNVVTRTRGNAQVILVSPLPPAEMHRVLDSLDASP